MYSGPGKHSAPTAMDCTATAAPPRLPCPWAAHPCLQCFNVGSVLDVVSMGTDISAPLATWGIAFTFTLGGAIFTGATGRRASGPLVPLSAYGWGGRPVEPRMHTGASGPLAAVCWWVVDAGASIAPWCQLPGQQPQSMAAPPHTPLVPPLPAVAGALQCLEETGSWWRGLVPTRWQDLHSLSWMAACLGFWGGVGFTINGAGLFGYSNRCGPAGSPLLLPLPGGCCAAAPARRAAPPASTDDCKPCPPGRCTCSWAQSKWLVAFGQIMGSVFFLLSGAAGMLEQANPGHL